MHILQVTGSTIDVDRRHMIEAHAHPFSKEASLEDDMLLCGGDGIP